MLLQFFVLLCFVCCFRRSAQIEALIQVVGSRHTRDVPKVASTRLKSSRNDSIKHIAEKVTTRHTEVELDRRSLLTTGLACASVATINVKSAIALSPEQASDAYDSYANTYNELDGGTAASALGINEARASLFSKATGRVLEIGVGTGLNLDYYNNNNIESLTLVDISQGMLEQAKERIKTLNNLQRVDIQVLQADATRDLVDLFGQASFDTVVDTFSLCVMGTQGAKAALQQMSLVVKPENGRVLLLENTKSSNKVLGWYQDLTAETAAAAGGKGCVYNQDVTHMIEETPGLSIVQEEAYSAGLFRSFECVSTGKS